MQIKCIKSKKNVVKYNQVPTYDLDSTDGREGSESWVFLVMKDEYSSKSIKVIKYPSVFRHINYFTELKSFYIGCAMALTNPNGYWKVVKRVRNVSEGTVNNLRQIGGCVHCWTISYSQAWQRYEKQM